MKVEDEIVYLRDAQVWQGRFADKNVLVTAGTKGIGRGIAHRLAAEGARVFVCSRKQENVDHLCKGLQKLGLDVDGVACNVTKEGQLAHFVKRGTEFFASRSNMKASEVQVHALISNVGVNPAAGSAFDATQAMYNKIFDANVKSHWELITLTRPFLKKGSSVLCVSSVGAFDPSPPLGLYGVSKTALVGLTKALTSELGPHGIRINTLCPGVVRTKMSELLWKTDMGDRTAQSVDLRRHGDPVDMGGVAAFLCSEDASFLTGEAVVVSGGTHSRL